MLRWCYVDHTLMLRWGDVDATVWVGWGGVGGCNNVHVSCVQGDATWMLRWCYVDHTLMLRWGDVDATVGVGWGGVGWGGAITFMYLACKVMRRGCCVDVTLIILWCYVEETLMLLLGWRKNCHNDMYKCLGDLCRKSGWNKDVGNAEEKA